MDFSFLLNSLGLGAYAVATISILLRLFHPKGANLVVILILGVLALLAHGGLLANQMFEPQMVNFNLANVVSLVALIISALVTIMALKYKIQLLLPVVYGFSAIWLLIEMLFHPSAEIPLTGDKLFIISHVSLALLAYCVLIIATLFAFLVRYINIKLKSKKLSGVNHLPPLMLVERQSFFILALGTLLLLISELNGFFFLENWITKENAHKTFLSLLALAAYIYTLYGHYAKGWRGNKVLGMTVLASFLLTLSYFVSRFVKEFLLS